MYNVFRKEHGRNKTHIYYIFLARTMLYECLRLDSTATLGSEPYKEIEHSLFHKTLSTENRTVLK